MGQSFPQFLVGSSLNIEEVELSSSGGMFFEIAKEILRQNGVVYGAVNIYGLNVKHKRATNIVDVKKMRKSKYLRSDIYGVYKNVKLDLENDKKVLFTGVGCQINGLYKFLKKDYSNLLTCEVICHGMPLSISWKKYIEETERKINEKFISIDFRDKTEGWKNNCILEKYSNETDLVNLSENHFVHKLYINGINLESGCTQCKYQKVKRESDLSLADYWNCNGQIKYKYNNSGVSLVAINNNKAKQFINKIKKYIDFEFINIEDAVNSCRHLSKAPYCHPSRKAFEKMLKTKRFYEIKDIFLNFGEVRLPNELAIYDSVDDNNIIKLFMKDTFEVAYFVKNDALFGIATFGDFLNKYAHNNYYINTEFVFVKYEKDYEKKIRQIFDGDNKINRIPVLDENNKIMFEVRRDKESTGINDDRKFLLLLEVIKKYKINCSFFNRPDYVDNYNYTLRQQIRIKNKISFPVIVNQPDKYIKEIKDIYRDKIKIDKYIQKLSKISPIYQMDGMYLHKDTCSEYINIIAGKRITVNNPDFSNINIHMYGRCGVFGYAVTDEETIPSVLQKFINKAGYKCKVINHGLWGADNSKIYNNIFNDILNSVIKYNDLIVFYMNIKQFRNKILDSEFYFYDTTDEFHSNLKNNINFYDCPGHMDANGYELIGNIMFNKLEAKLKSIDNVNISKENRKITLGCIPNEIQDYLNKIKKLIPNSFIQKKLKYGAIVMNCNPFTKGHLYLIKEASKRVDRLFIFVVEENRSFFTFEQRFEMVKKGVKNIDNVCVLPSGKYMISAITFPEYFIKDNVKDVDINPTLDVNIFAKYICPELNITKRFVGTEPNDFITNQYNLTLKEILPLYKIDLIEIERISQKDIPISASQVRKLLKDNNWNEISKIVPATTLKILKNM